MQFLNSRLTVRLNAETSAKVYEVVATKQMKYFSVSHFIRCAVIKLLREEGYDGRAEEESE